MTNKINIVTVIRVLDPSYVVTGDEKHTVYSTTDVDNETIDEINESIKKFRDGVVETLVEDGEVVLVDEHDVCHIIRARKNSVTVSVTWDYE